MREFVFGLELGVFRLAGAVGREFRSGLHRQSRNFGIALNWVLVSGPVLGVELRQVLPVGGRSSGRFGPGLS